MPEPLDDLRPHLIQVLDALGGGVEGTGFLAHPDGFALTCWHVVKDWSGRGCRGEVLWDGKRVSAELLLDRSVEAADLAVLKLTCSTAVQGGREWPFLHLDGHWRIRMQDVLRSFGFPQGRFDKSGIETSGQIVGRERISVNGIEMLPITGHILDNIDLGYSGAPVVNDRTEKVVGLVHAKQHERQAFIVPLAPLFAAWPELHAFHDVFEQIRRKLGEQAQTALGEKLHDAPFIPLKLEAGRIAAAGDQATPDSRGKLKDETLAHGRRWERFDVEALLPLRGRYVLSADVGTGKTTFIHWLASELVRRTRLLPVVMPCRELERLAPKRRDDVLEALIEGLTGAFLRVDLQECFASSSRDNRLVFLFDGLDQIRGELPSDIVKLALSLADRSPVLVTSRPSAVIAVEDDRELAFLRLQLFSRQDQRRYFGAHYLTAKAVCEIAPDLTRVPMLASMVRELVEKGALKEAATRTELYGQFLHYVLAKHESNKALKDKPGLLTKVERVLGRFAFDALAQAKPHIQRVPIEGYADEVSIPLSELIAFGLVNRILDTGEEALFFTHQSFQEFLAAKHAARTSQAVEQVLNERWHPKWAEVIRFLAGLKGEPILEKILAEPDNVICSNLFLAARCMSEVKTPSARLANPIKAKLFELTKIEPFRLDAILALGGLGRLLNHDDVKRVIQWVGNSDWRIRPRALEELASLDQRWIIRWNVFRALGSLDDRLDAQAVRAIVGRLSDKNSDVCTAAVEALASLDDRLDAEAVRAIVGLLSDIVSDTREAAVKALASLGDRLDAEAVRAIVGLLTDKDSDVRAATVKALGSLGDRLDAEAVGAIVGRLSDEDSGVRETAVKALGSLGDLLDAEAIRTIARLLSDTFWDTREAAVTALASLGDRLDAEAVGAIVGRLSDEIGNVRCAALKALGSLGDRLDADAVRAIFGRLRDVPLVRKAAVGALESLGNRLDAEAFRTIVAGLSDKDSGVRTAAVKALGSLGDRLDAEAMGAIVGRLGDEDSRARKAAVEALGSLGDRLDANALGAIVGRARDNKSSVRTAAVKALGLLGDRLDAEAMGAIVGRLSDEDSRVRCLAVKTLGSLGDRLDADALRAIVCQLRDVPLVRQAAVGVLASLGDQLDVETVGAIVGLLSDDDEQRAHGCGQSARIAGRSARCRGDGRDRWPAER